MTTIKCLSGHFSDNCPIESMFLFLSQFARRERHQLFHLLSKKAKTNSNEKVQLQRHLSCLGAVFDEDFVVSNG